MTYDSDLDKLEFLFDWGDGTDSGWLGQYASGETCEALKTWDTEGVYQIKVKARDINGGESDWSDSLSVSMPKNKTLNILLRLFENYNWILSFIKTYIGKERI